MHACIVFIVFVWPSTPTLVSNRSAICMVQAHTTNNYILARAITNAIGYCTTTISCIKSRLRVTLIYSWLYTNCCHFQYCLTVEDVALVIAGLQSTVRHVSVTTYS